MTTLPRYALQLPDGRWAYYLPDPGRPPGTRTGLFADGDRLHPLEPLAGPNGHWYAGDRHAQQITATYQPPPTTIGYRLTDPKAQSERYPAELSVADFSERSKSREEYWALYDRITEDQPAVELVHEGPFMPLEGRQPPASDEPPWRTELPSELTQRAEYRHLFPGRIPGLKQHLEARIKQMPKVQYCFVDYQGRSGLHVGLRLPFDQPRTAFKADIGRRGRTLKSGRTVQVLVNRELDLPVPADVTGDNYEAALADWHQQVKFWITQVEEATVAACSACDAKGYLEPKDRTPAAEARARLAAMVSFADETDETEFHRRIDAVAAAENATLRDQVARVRSFATGHEYRWLHELLDGHGTHGGHL